MNAKSETQQRMAPLATPTSLRSEATRDISGALNALLADVFSLYLKTKNLHLHMSGPSGLGQRGATRVHQVEQQVRIGGNRARDGLR
jgi:hypothetical protein